MHLDTACTLSPTVHLVTAYNTVHVRCRVNMCSQFANLLACHFTVTTQYRSGGPLRTRCPPLYPTTYVHASVGSNRCLTGVEKYKQAEKVCLQIANLISCTGMRTFHKHLRLLDGLVTQWSANSEATKIIGAPEA